MERKVIDRRKVVIGYGLIVIIVNIVGFLMANSGGMPITETEDYLTWIKFMDEHAYVPTILSIISFIIPATLIFGYRRRVAKDNDSIINVPFIFSALACIGWIFSFIMESICLLYVKGTYHIQIGEIMMVSFFNIVQVSICIFTLSFLILNFIHRKFVLPQIYPDGNLSEISKGMKPSVRFLVIIFYLSICIFPVFFLASSLFSIIQNNHIIVNPTIFIVLGLIIILSGIILWAFCDYFTAPLAKLKIGVQKIKAGEYEHHVDIVSNDDFGELADAFNDMSLALDEKNKKIHAIQNSIIKGMAVMVESRDNSTGGHISRTSDCVKVFVEKLPNGEHKIRISGLGTFDHENLQYLGSGDKVQDLFNAGGFGEGSKIVVANLLGKGDAKSVKFACSDWELVYDSAKGIMRRTVKKASTPISGNNIEFTTSNKKLVDSIIDSVNYFEHSGNPDFQGLTYDSKSFAFKYFAILADTFSKLSSF